MSERRALLQRFSPDQLRALHYDWRFWARPNQLPPAGDWRIWLVLAGRGFGKTRTGAEWVQDRVRSGVGRSIAFIAKTPADARDVMVEQGESSILKIAAPHERPKYEPSKRRLTWPNGAHATIYSSEEPGSLRGPQHDTIWADELVAWLRPQETWDMAMMGLRLGDDPRALVTTTPKPMKVLLDLVKRTPNVVITRGSSYENRANLASAWFSELVAKYEGTTLGQQELHAALLEEMPGALWTRAVFDAHRVTEAPVPLVRVVAAIDPASKSREDSDESGIICAGLARNRHVYVLADVSERDSPLGVCRRAIQAVKANGGNTVVYEANQGGDWIRTTLRQSDNTLILREVTASKSKQARAEPVAALYEQGRVHHVGTFQQLEDQCCTWVAKDEPESPDRLDALVWAITDLMPDATATLAPAWGLERSNPWIL